MNNRLLALGLSTVLALSTSPVAGTVFAEGNAPALIAAEVVDVSDTATEAVEITQAAVDEALAAAETMEEGMAVPPFWVEKLEMDDGSFLVVLLTDPDVSEYKLAEDIDLKGATINFFFEEKEVTQTLDLNGYKIFGGHSKGGDLLVHALDGKIPKFTLNVKGKGEVGKLWVHNTCELNVEDATVDHLTLEENTVTNLKDCIVNDYEINGKCALSVEGGKWNSDIQMDEMNTASFTGVEVDGNIRVNKTPLVMKNCKVTGYIGAYESDGVNLQECIVDKGLDLGKSTGTIVGGSYPGEEMEWEPGNIGYRGININEESNVNLIDVTTEMVEFYQARGSVTNAVLTGHKFGTEDESLNGQSVRIHGGSDVQLAGVKGQGEFDTSGSKVTVSGSEFGGISVSESDGDLASNITIKDTKLTSFGFYYKDPKGTMVIESGNFYGEYGSLFEAPEAKVTIKGGTFEVGEVGPAIGVIGDNIPVLKNMLGSGCKYLLADDDNKEATDDDYVYVEGGNFTTLKSGKVIVQSFVQPAAMYRLYNPNSGEHFFTASKEEYDSLGTLGWKQEGNAWIAPDMSETPVYRLYNDNNRDSAGNVNGYHHYTTSAAERDNLVSLGWKDEGIGWYSDDNETTPLYRVYNPNAKGDQEPGGHHYTGDAAERDYLVGLGWNDEGTGWYGM